MFNNKKGSVYIKLVIGLVLLGLLVFVVAPKYIDRNTDGKFTEIIEKTQSDLNKGSWLDF